MNIQNSKINSINKNQFMSVQNILSKSKYSSKLNWSQEDSNKIEAERAEMQEKIASKIEAIRNKLRNGEKLSPQEKEFLKEHDPELYAKVMKLDAERERFHLELNACRSKKDAFELYSQKTLNLMKNKNIDSDLLVYMLKMYEDEFKKYSGNKNDNSETEDKNNKSVYKLI